MCGICGVCNLNRNISNNDAVIRKMNNSLSKRGPDEDGYFISSNLLFGHKRLIVIDPKRWKAANDI